MWWCVAPKIISAWRQLAAHAACPIINGLTDLYHPCQALADLFTLAEVHRRLAGLKLAYVGDANNVARSLADCLRPSGCQVCHRRASRLTSSKRRSSSNWRNSIPAWTSRLRPTHGKPSAMPTLCTPMSGSAWDRRPSVSSASRRWQRYQVNGELMAAAPSRATFMHCLPARRGEEVTDEVMDGPQSIVVQQAANRMHLQKGLLAWLLSHR